MIENKSCPPLYFHIILNFISRLIKAYLQTSNFFYSRCSFTLPLIIVKKKKKGKNVEKIDSLYHSDVITVQLVKIGKRQHRAFVMCPGMCMLHTYFMCYVQALFTNFMHVGKFLHNCEFMYVNIRQLREPFVCFENSFIILLLSWFMEIMNAAVHQSKHSMTGSVVLYYDFVTTVAIVCC